jgi:hypothetical protein
MSIRECVCTHTHTLAHTHTHTHTHTPFRCRYTCDMICGDLRKTQNTTTRKFVDFINTLRARMMNPSSSMRESLSSSPEVNWFAHGAYVLPQQQCAVVAIVTRVQQRQQSPTLRSSNTHTQPPHNYHHIITSTLAADDDVDITITTTATTHSPNPTQLNFPLQHAPHPAPPYPT